MFATTIGENIKLGGTGHVTQEQVEEAAKQSNCYDFISELPKVNINTLHIMLDSLSAHSVRSCHQLKNATFCDWMFDRQCCIVKCVVI